MKDGTLDFEDEVLAQLDYVVASVHNAFTLPEDEMTARLIRAMENKHVTMLGHVTGRLLLQRPSYAVNLPKIIDAAAATGTIIELNASPWRLDMDWRWWKLARDKGVKTSINPDAHSTRGLQDLFFGIRSARKGWLTKDCVINSQSLEEVEKTIQIKRERMG
jgi:DNA polymerase (family 10)